MSTLPKEARRAMSIIHAVYGREYRDAAEIAVRLAEIDQQHPGQRYPKAIADEVEGLRATLGDIDAERRLSVLRSAAQNPANREPGDGNVPLHEHQGDGRSREARGLSAGRDGALRAIDRHARTGLLRSDAADRLDMFVRRQDALGLDSAYLEAVGDENYNTAFGKICNTGRWRRRE